MFRFAIWLYSTMGIAFLLPIPGCVIPAAMLFTSITLGLLIAE